jgi:Type VI secretion system VasI, EvfG, VC_A0118
MKKIIAVLALCGFAQGALAAGPDCRAIQSAGERLACYDAASAPKKDKPAPLETDASRAAYQDPLIAEDARTAAKLKNICRGC